MIRQNQTDDDMIYIYVSILISDNQPACGAVSHLKQLPVVVKFAKLKVDGNATKVNFDFLTVVSERLSDSVVGVAFK